jgi:hypothetical protein
MLREEVYARALLASQNVKSAEAARVRLLLPRRKVARLLWSRWLDGGV